MQHHPLGLPKSVKGKQKGFFGTARLVMTAPREKIIAFEAQAKIIDRSKDSMDTMTRFVNLEINYRYRSYWINNKRITAVVAGS